MAFNLDSTNKTFTSDDTGFYVTYARSRPNELVPWIEAHQVPLLTNAMHRWSEAQAAFLHMWEYDTPHVIDAGGYNVQRKWVADNGENVRGQLTSDTTKEVVAANRGALESQLSDDSPFYPWSLEEYHEWCSEWAHEHDWVTVMDYACEEKFDPLWSVEERVEKTLEHTVRHYDLDPDYTVLPVLQGRTVDSYVRCYEFLEDHGIPCDHVGLGTVCRLSSEKRIVEVERQVRERTGVDKLHGFGVKVAAYKHGATFDSADSQAWVYSASNGEVVHVSRTPDGGLRIDTEPCSDSLYRTVQSFKSYYTYVSWLMDDEPAVGVDTAMEGAVA